eukprot:3874657-Pyramimonas_sp.AAC.1
MYLSISDRSRCCCTTPRLRWTQDAHHGGAKGTKSKKARPLALCAECLLLPGVLLVPVCSSSSSFSSSLFGREAP